MSNEETGAVSAASNITPEATDDSVATESQVPATIDEQISTATVSNYQDVLGEIALLEDSVVQDSYITTLAKALGISKTLFTKELKKKIAAIGPLAGDDQAEGTKRAIFPGLVDLVKDDAGKIRYLVKQEGGVHLAESWMDEDGYPCIPPEKNNIEFQLPDATRVMSYYEDTDDHRIYEDLQVFFKRFSYLNDEAWPIIILSVFLSYIQDHPDVRYIPGIYFYAAAERGKSRTAKTMLATSYRGIHLVDIRPANIIRFSERLNATLFFDITDLWKSAEKGEGAQDILLGRFEKGTRVARVLNPEKGPFDDQTFFSVYGSTIFATNEPANSIFESRCLSISMPNKPGHYENLTPEMGLPFKDRLTAWRARMMERSLPYVEPVPGVGGRLWDISRPLFQLAMMVAPESFDLIKKVVLEMAGQKVENKRETLEGKIIGAIDKLVDKKAPEPWEVPVEDIRSRVNSNIAAQYQHNPQKIGRRIQSLSIKSKKVNGMARITITEHELNVLKEQHGLMEPTVAGETLPLSTTRLEAATTGHDAGRESEESQELATDSPEQKSDDLQEDRRVVESSGESPDLPATEADEQHQAYLHLITGTEELTATDHTETGHPEKAKVIDMSEYAAKTASPDQDNPVKEKVRAKIRFATKR